MITRNTPTNVPSRTTPAVAERVAELNEESREAAAQRRIAELTGQDGEREAMGPHEQRYPSGLTGASTEPDPAEEPDAGVLDETRRLTPLEEAALTAPTREAAGSVDAGAGKVAEAPGDELCGLSDDGPGDGPFFSDETELRALALERAKDILTTRGPLGMSGAVPPGDLIRVASWILGEVTDDR